MSGVLAVMEDRGLATVEKQSSPTLAQLDKARQMLADCRDLSEVKKIRDVAESAKMYAKAANLGREAQNYAAEISLLAARKAGEILKQLARKQGERTDKHPASVAGGSEYSKTLKDTGTKERTAQQWQKLAAIPQPTFENYISDTQEKQQDITAAGLLKLSPKAQTKTQPILNQSVSDLRAWIKTDCPSLDAVIRKHVKYDEASENFDLEMRGLSADEVKFVCKQARIARAKEVV